MTPALQVTGGADALQDQDRVPVVHPVHQSAGAVVGVVELTRLSPLHGDDVHVSQPHGLRLVSGGDVGHQASVRGDQWRALDTGARHQEPGGEGVLVLRGVLHGVHHRDVAVQAAGVDARVRLVGEDDVGPVRGPVPPGDGKVAVGDLVGVLLKAVAEGSHVDVAEAEVRVGHDHVPLLLHGGLPLLAGGVPHGVRQVAPVRGDGVRAHALFGVGHLVGFTAGQGECPHLILSAPRGGEEEPGPVG
jgi:hypothetical protein